MMTIQYHLSLLVVVIAGCFTSIAAPGQSFDTDTYYKKADSWHETMWASLEAFSREATVSLPKSAIPDLGMTDMTIMAWIRTTEGGVVFSVSSEEGDWAEHGSKALLIRDGRFLSLLDEPGTILPVETASGSIPVRAERIRPESDEFLVWIQLPQPLLRKFPHDPAKTAAITMIVTF